jgi:eukaryotic-like serine/threonine-protein kinase
LGRLDAILKELHKRRVFRAAAAYGIVAFAVLQVSEPVIHGLQLPEWVLSAVVVTVLLAFPVAMVLAWIFDFGPEGIERTPVESPSDPGMPGPAPAFAPPVRRGWARKPTWAAIGTLGLAAGALLSWRVWPGPAPPRSRITVAVADFANETRDPELEGLSTMLITSLEQSRHLAVLTRTRMLDLLRQLGKEDVTRLDEPLGREVAVRAGARALFTASVHRFDRTYAIELKALDPATSEYLFAAKEEGTGKGSVPGMIDRLSDRARRALREREEEVRASRVEVGTAVTTNLTAFSSYFQGTQAKDHNDAVEWYEKAIAADPGFGLAYYQIAYLAEFIGLPRERQEQAIAAAVRLAPRLPEKERLLILAWKAHLDGHAEEARALYRRAVEVAPQDKEVLYLSGDIHFHAGEHALAAPFFERALALDPGWTPAADHLVECLQALGRRDEMLAVAERAAQARPGENSRLVIWARLEREEPEEAIAVARRQARSGDPDAVDMFISVLQWQLRLGESEVEARKLLAPEVPPDQRVEAWHSLAKISLLQGREAEALSRLRAAADEKASRAKAIHAWDTYTTLAILHRDRHAIERGLAELHHLGAPFHRYASFLEYTGEHEWAARLAAGAPAGESREYWEAYVAWHRGDPDAAERTFRRLKLTYEFAQLLAEQGRDGEVVAVLVRRPSTYWMSIPETWILARYRVLLAQSLHRLGRDGEARAELDRFFEPLEHPDPGWAPLVQANALKAELARAPRSAARR